MITMTDQEKINIRRRRERGESIGKIAKAMGINVNTVKSFCRRDNIEVIEEPEMEKVQEVMDSVPASTGFCNCCGKNLPAQTIGRPRRFCSDDCRAKFWSGVKTEYTTKHICPSCGIEFQARKERQYCSHACYINNRFGEKGHV